MEKQNSIQIFSNSEFGEIRTVVIDGEPWFVANDVGKALGYSDPRSGAKKLVDDEDKQVVPLDSAGQTRTQTIVNESGLYALIFGSTLESAKKFKKWVTSEVLPTIRKTGGYGTAQLPMTTEDQIELLAQGHGKLKAEIREVKSELDKFKEELPLLPVEMQEITEAVHKKGVSVMGGKKSPAYHDRSICQSVYRDIYNEIHRNFGCFTYKAIPRKYLSKVLDVVEKYALPVVLSDRISDANNQLSFM